MLKRVQAGHLLGSSLKLQATLQLQAGKGKTNRNKRGAAGGGVSEPAAEAALSEALVVLQVRGVNCTAGWGENVHTGLGTALGWGCIHSKGEG